MVTNNLAAANCTGSSLFEEEHASGNPNAVSLTKLENDTNDMDKPPCDVLIDLVSTSIHQLADF